MKSLPTPAALLLSALVAACDASPPAVDVAGAWMRPTTSSASAESPPAAPAAVYLTIENTGGTPDRVLDVRSDACEHAMLHRTVVDGDRVGMDAVDGLELPAGERVVFEPGGLHVMLHGLRRHYRAGDRFTLSLELEATGEVAVDVEVRAP